MPGQRAVSSTPRKGELLKTMRTFLDDVLGGIAARLADVARGGTLQPAQAGAMLQAIRSFTERERAIDDPPFFFVLGGEDGKTPTPATYRQWRETINHPDVPSIAETDIGGTTVKTTFWGIDGDRRGYLFESAIWRGTQLVDVKRYRTHDEAVDGHAGLVGAYGGRCTRFRES